MADTKKDSLLEMFRKAGYRTAKIDDLIRWLQDEQASGHTWIALDGTMQTCDGAILWSNKAQM